MSQDELIEQLYRLKDSLERLPVLSLYYGWLEYYKDNESAKYFIESLARKYVYNQIKYNNPGAEQSYEKYLEKFRYPFIVL